MEIGVDINFCTINQLQPISLAVQSGKIETVKLLLHYGINHENVKSAIVTALGMSLDDITGLLIEHIAVDRNQDMVTLSGLDLKMIKPLWILPSLGFKRSKEATKGKTHRRRTSLGLLKDNILQRKQVSTDKLSDSSFQEASGSKLTSSNRRRASIDVTALTFLSSFQKDENDDCLLQECDEVDGATSDIENTTSTSQGSTDKENNSSKLLTSTVLDGNSKVVPRIAFHKPVLGAISGAKSLPRGQLDQYDSIDKPMVRAEVSGAKSPFLGQLDHTEDSIDGNFVNISTFEEYSFSPAQLCKQLRRFQREQKASEMMKSGIYYPVLEEMVSVKQNNTNLSDSHTTSFSGSDTTNSSIFESESETSGVWNSSNSSCKNNLPNRALFQSPQASGATEQVDNLVAESTHLIKVLDISSNKLVGLEDFVRLPYGGNFLFKYMKEVKKFDAKQNALSCLPEVMMKVGFNKLRLWSIFKK